MTVADYANADPAVVKSGRVKKAVINAVEKEGRLYVSGCILDFFLFLFYYWHRFSFRKSCGNVNLLVLSASQVTVWPGGLRGCCG